MHRMTLFTLLLGCSLILQCSNKSANPVVTKPPRDLTVAEKQLVASDNKFGLKLFREIVARDTAKNVFVSPLSVSMALGMTYNGAKGATQEAMQQTLELQGMTIEEVNQSYRSLIDLLRGLDSKVTFDIANSIWYRLGFEVESTFVDLNRTYFDAEVRGLDFTSPSALPTINGWVNDKTKGKIESILTRIPDEVVMYLIDAIYFKGTWKYRFDASKTLEVPFHLPDGSTTPCQMMYLPESSVSMLGHRLFRAVDLAYGNGDYSMTIFLPTTNSNTDSILSVLTDDNWRSWLESFRTAKEDIRVPRFEIEYEITLNEMLKTLGMGVAFSGNADFTGINRLGGLAISEVKHKSYVKVDEEGTEAAAVTSVAIVTTGYPDEEFIVNRPFLFVIHENHSGAILFMGKIADPIAPKE